MGEDAVNPPFFCLENPSYLLFQMFTLDTMHNSFFSFARKFSFLSSVSSARSLAPPTNEPLLNLRNHFIPRPTTFRFLHPVFSYSCTAVKFSHKRIRHTTSRSRSSIGSKSRREEEEKNLVFSIDIISPSPLSSKITP